MTIGGDRQDEADIFAAQHGPDLAALRKRDLPWARIADHMNQAGHTAAKGGPWTGTAVKRTLMRFLNMDRSER